MRARSQGVWGVHPRATHLRAGGLGLHLCTDHADRALVRLVELELLALQQLAGRLLVPENELFVARM